MKMMRSFSVPVSLDVGITEDSVPRKLAFDNVGEGFSVKKGLLGGWQLPGLLTVVLFV